MQTLSRPINANSSIRSGFTLVELLIVIVVIAILAAISVVAYNGIQDRAKASAIVSDLKAAEKAFQLYKTASGASSWWIETDPDLLSGGSASLASIISRNTEFRNFLQKAPTTEGLQTSTQWAYDNDGDTYNGCSRSYAGVNIFIGGVQDHDMAKKVDELIDDGDIDCGKFHRHLTSDNAYMYTIAPDSNS